MRVADRVQLHIVSHRGQPLSHAPAPVQRAPAPVQRAPAPVQRALAPVLLSQQPYVRGRVVGSFATLWTTSRILSKTSTAAASRAARGLASARRGAPRPAEASARTRRGTR